MSQYAWLFLVRVRAIRDNEVMFAGSEAQLQCCVPGESVEQALSRLPEFLASEGYARLDISLANRFDMEDEEQEFPAEYVEKELRLVNQTGAPRIACVFVSKDTAVLRKEPLQ